MTVPHRQLTVAIEVTGRAFPIRRSRTHHPDVADRRVHLTEEVDCLHCDRGPHRIDLVVTVRRGQMTFRGSNADTVDAPCPVTGRSVPVRARVPLGPEEKVIDVRVGRAGEVHPAPFDLPDDPVTGSRDDPSAIGRDAAGKLLAAGTAAVAAYLALLRYVAGESLAGWRLALGVLPAVGYLVVTVLSAVALRPLLARVYDRREAELFLERVLRRQSRLLTAAVTVLVASTAAAVAALLVLLA